MTLRHLPLLVLLFTAGGCGFLFKSPNKANVELRRENQKLEDQIAELQRQHAADVATVRGLNERAGTVKSLEPARLEKLFTVHAVTLGRLTGGADLDPGKPGHEGLKVYVNLLDQHGDAFKASGSFVVEAFDLADPKAPRLGRWEFPVEKSQEYWHSFLTRYEYVLPCPWQQSPPRHPDVTVRVQYTDELTGRVFVEQRVAKVEVPPSTPTAPAGTQPVGLGN